MTAALFTRYGSEPYAGAVSVDEKGRPFRRYISTCSRCGGAGRSDKWMHTGFTCYDCGGSGKGPEKVEPLYTAEKIAKLNAAADKRVAKRAAEAKAAEELRRAPFLAWSCENEHVIGEVRRHLPEENDLRARLESSFAASVIPPAWLLSAAVDKIVRSGAQEDERAKSVHVGLPGARIELTVTCERLLDYPAEWPQHTFYVALMRDRAGNSIVYKGGNPPLNKGETARVKATVKAHDERNGEAQTIIARPKVLEIIESETRLTGARDRDEQQPEPARSAGSTT